MTHRPIPSRALTRGGGLLATGKPLSSIRHRCKEITVLPFNVKDNPADNEPLNFGNFFRVSTTGNLTPELNLFRCKYRSTPVHMVQVRRDRRRMGPTNDEQVEDEYE